MLPASSLGLDIGSSSVKAVILDAQNRVTATYRCVTQGRPLRGIEEALAWAASLPESSHIAVGITGSGQELVHALVRVPGINEIVAAARGAEVLQCRASTLIEIGSQFAKWIRLDANGAVNDYATNDLCAAGSGGFLEQQASRLRISIDELAKLAAQAPRGATIAGRCSVFAKSDMIHLQQNGTPCDELAYGLCLAVARNFIGTILRGREVQPPVAFLGGTAANAGLVRAFREVLCLPGNQLFVPTNFEFFAAVGACAAAREAADSTPVQTLLAAVNRNAPKARRHGRSSLAPLRLSMSQAPSQEPIGIEAADVSAFLGVDVGSVSTDLVLMAPDGAVIDSIYLATRGRPLDVLSEALEQFHLRYGGRLRILGTGVTGSGRHLASAFLGADITKNEITAQVMGTTAYFPDVDSIFEIGGQDSKYIRVRDAKVLDFAMNKICAAGTGSFLEEQAERLGINIIGEFAELAMESRAPADLGNRCTVFMDSELVFAQQAGASTEDLTAGLAYAIAHNYIEKVVAGKPVGNHVVFQGGVASNRAVVAAFENLLGHPIHVHPYNRISGAIGAARLAKNAYEVSAAPSRFRGFSACKNYQTATFECKACANMCQVNRFSVNGEITHFGDACERYSGRKGNEAVSRWPNLFQEREDLLDGFTGSPHPNPRGNIGIPRASLVHELSPFWMAFLRRLGYRVTLSSPSSSAIFSKGLRFLPVETCLPIKITFGHVVDLKEKGVDAVFLPSVPHLPCPEAADARIQRTVSDRSLFGAPCIYSEHVPYMVKAAAPTQVIAPRIPIGEDAREMARAFQSLAPQLGASARQIAEALEIAHENQKGFARALQQRGQQILNDDFDRAFVVVGRPYNLYDPFQNLNLAVRLRRFGLPVIPMGFLPLDQIELGQEWDDLLWKFNRDCIRAAYFLRDDHRLIPIVLSSFGCGPDGFMIKPLERLFGDRPHLFLEFDEHRGEAGLITRLEAFMDEIDATHDVQAQPQRWRRAARSHSPLPKRGTVFIPRFADHAYAISGALRAAGYETEVLPAPTEASVEAGRAHMTGRECHPYTMMAGDLAFLARSSRWKRGDIFLMPGTTEFPCLISQFNASCHDILDDLGVRELEVATRSIGEIMKQTELPGATRLWQGLVAIDLLTRLECEKRPYEMVPGETNQYHEPSLREIEAGLATGNILAAVRHCVERLDRVQTIKRSPRPIIGVAGDIYTRINPFSNDDLFARLEAAGCEVWPASFMVDTVDFILRQEWGRSLLRRRFGQALTTGVYLLIKEFARARVRGSFQHTLLRWHEPGYDEVTRLAAPYADPRSNYVILLNIAKMVEFAQNGAHGIINAMGFNCMVGTVSAALLNRIRAAHGDIPAINLIYGGTDPAPQRARLDAFVHQVKLYAAQERNAQHATQGSKVIA